MISAVQADQAIATPPSFPMAIASALERNARATLTVESGISDAAATVGVWDAVALTTMTVVRTVMAVTTPALLTDAPPTDVGKLSHAEECAQTPHGCRVMAG